MARYGLLIWILWFASGAFAQEGKVDYELDLEEVPVLAKRPLKHIGRVPGHFRFPYAGDVERDENQFAHVGDGGFFHDTLLFYR